MRAKLVVGSSPNEEGFERRLNEALERLAPARISGVQFSFAACQDRRTERVERQFAALILYEEAQDHGLPVDRG